MAPTDLSPKDSASATKIVGEDESLCADVVTENGDNCLTVKVCNPEDIGDDGGGDPDDTPGCPTLSYKLVHDFSGANITVPSGYVTLFQYSGSGKLIGFVFDFNSQNVTVKLTVDSMVIFELDMNDLEDIQVEGGGGDDDDGGAGSVTTCGGPVFDTIANKLCYQPPCPIAYDTEVKVEAKRVGGSNRTMTDRIVHLTKAT